MSRPARRWLVPAATLVLLVLGTAALTLALALGLADGAREDVGPAASPSPSAATAPEVPVVTAVPDAPVAELADPAWVSATARATGVPERALAAYAGAAVAVADTHPGCGLGWNTLAAIGEVESEHGSIGGATLDASGDTSPPIIGVALDGDGVQEIRDTDGGRLDQDETWDRAVGPMQFIPSTWKAHAADGNGDGTSDVHHIDDAALAAADHLCSAGGDLTRPEDWIAAISDYNRGADYNRRVVEVATRYAEVAGR